MKQYSFENGKIFVRLPLELKNENTIVNDERIAYGQSYRAGNDQINIILSFSEFKAGYEFILSDMFSSSLENLQNAKDIQIISHTYKEFKYNNYPAGKMTVEYITKDLKCTIDYVYILVANNKCWYLSYTYQTEDNDSKKKSDKIMVGIQVNKYMSA